MIHLKTLLALGFRPFFLVSGIAAFLLIPLWLLVYAGVIDPSVTGWQNPIYWHGHEMIFGFGFAVVAGFLATATQNWTGIPGISGWRLGLLVGVWIAARLSPYIGLGGTWGYAITDLSFAILYTVFISKYLLAPGQQRNWILYLVFLMMLGGNLAIHLEAMGYATDIARRGLYFGLYGILAAIILIGGRVIPFFTRSATGADVSIKPKLEVLAYISVFLFAVVEGVIGHPLAIAVCGLLAGVIHAIRWSGWGWRKTLGMPVLWVLHAGYLFVISGFFLKALEPYIAFQGMPGTHAFGVGAIGIVAYGMMTRVALGHTGRMIKPLKSIELGYVLVITSAIVRIVGTVLPGELYLITVITAGSLWTAAFALFVWTYAPILCQPRLDGRPG